MKSFLNFKLNESMGSPSDPYTIELDHKEFDINILSSIYVNKEGEIKIAPKDELLSDLSDLGMDQEYDYEIDNSSQTLKLRYYWDIESRSYGIKDFEFSPVSAEVFFIVNRIDDEGNEEEFEASFEITKFGNFRTEIKFPLSQFYVEVNIGDKNNKDLSDLSKWEWDFEIGSDDRY